MPDSLESRSGIVIALPADLIFGARIRAAAESVGANIVLAKNPDDVVSKATEQGTRLIILDLDRRGLNIADVITKLKATSSAPILAYVSHVREDAIREAKQAGADRVIARGAFANQLPDLLKIY
jgi:CheY-like chemotaxis protein